MENIKERLTDVVTGYLRSEEDNVTGKRIKHVLDKAAEMLEGLSVHVSENDKEETYEHLLKLYRLYVEPSVVKFETNDGYKVKITAVRDGKDATLPFMNHLACVMIDAKHHAESNNLTAIAGLYRDEFSAIYRATHELEEKR